MFSCSVNIIARDAEGTIKDCLDSLIAASCFSEIIIVLDSRTRDNTLELLRQYQSPIPLRVIVYNWNRRGFSCARNEALRYSKGKYIFWLDSDEILLDSPRGLLENPKGNAFYIHKISVLPDGSRTETKQIGLFPNLPGLRWRLPVHEQIIYSLEDKGVKILDSDIRIYHSGYSSADSVRQKHIRNYPLIICYLSEQHPDREKKYLEDRLNDTRHYLSGLSMGWLTIALTIVSAAIPLIQQGVSYNQAMNSAIKQAKIQHAMTEAELDQVAQLMTLQYPIVSFDEWRNYVKLAVLGAGISPPESQTPDQPEPEQKSDFKKYIPYILAFAIIAAVIK